MRTWETVALEVAKLFLTLSRWLVVVLVVVGGWLGHRHLGEGGGPMASGLFAVSLAAALGMATVNRCR